MAQWSWRARSLVLALASMGCFVGLEMVLPEVAHAATSAGEASDVLLGGTLGMAAVLFASSVVASAFCAGAGAGTRMWRRVLPLLVNALTILWIATRD